MESGGLLGNLMLHLRTQNEKERISEMKKKKKKKEARCLRFLNDQKFIDSVLLSHSKYSTI